MDTVPRLPIVSGRILIVDDDERECAALVAMLAGSDFHTQIAGDGFRIKVNPFRRALRSSPALQDLLGRYSVVLAMQISQTAACNRLHDIERRLARWLLLAQDRVDEGCIAMTHDFLATMLGTDRPSVSVAAANLQRKEIIDYTRGSVQILNRKELEKCACECYQIIQQFNGEIDLR